MKPRVGKPPLGILPRYGLEAASGGMEHGAGKYWPRNYEDCPEDESFLYIHALLRHATAMASGEFIDEESGVPHIALLLAGGMIYCQITKTGYVEPKIMQEFPERKARLNSMAAMFGPRPPHPVDVKQNAELYHAAETPLTALSEASPHKFLVLTGEGDRQAYDPGKTLMLSWETPMPHGMRFAGLEISASVPRSAAAEIKISQAKLRIARDSPIVDKRAAL